MIRGTIVPGIPGITVLTIPGIIPEGTVPIALSSITIRTMAPVAIIPGTALPSPDAVKAVKADTMAEAVEPAIMAEIIIPADIPERATTPAAPVLLPRAVEREVPRDVREVLLPVLMQAAITEADCSHPHLQEAATIIVVQATTAVAEVHPPAAV